MIYYERIRDRESEASAYQSMAFTLGVYYRALMTQGFTASEAMQIVLSYQRDLVVLSSQKGPKP